jgi:hypothetical protein
MSNFVLPSLERMLSVVLTLCLVCGGLSAQKPANPSIKGELICGVPIKQNIAPAGTPPEDIIFDRFGGSYSLTEMMESSSFSATLDCNTSGDFTLILDDQNGTFSDEESSVICDVFSYLSDLLNVQSGEKAIVRLIKDSSLPSSTIATGSGYYPNECGLGHSLIHRQFTIGGQPQTEHGFITINPNLNYYYAGYEGTMNITDEIDFYTVILHEALHTMGFTSQISDSGAPEQDFYTQWDLGLTAPNGEPLILRSEIGDNECCATFSFNPATNLILPNDIINQSCGTTVAYNANSLAPVYADYGEVENIDFINRLSHLSNVCTTDGTKHVMNATIPAGEDGVQRTISSVESEILCSLGFEVLNGTCNDPNDCITIAEDDGTYYVGLGLTITIPISELLANDNTNDNFPTLIANCENSEGISVNQQFINYRVTGNSLGSFSFCYSLNDCDGESCDVAKVKVVVTNPNIRRDCPENEDCQINPYSDFSLFGSSDEALRDLSNGTAGTNGSNNFIFVGTFNSPDFLRAGSIFFNEGLTCNPDFSAPYQAPDEISVIRCGHVVRNGIRHAREGIVLPLCEPIRPNMSAEITFFSVAFSDCIDQDLNLQIDFTELPPVSNEIIYDNPGIVVPSIIYPIVNAVESQNINERNTVTVQNNSDACLNYLYLSPSFLGELPSDFSVQAGMYVGDIDVTLKNNLTDVLRLTATPISSQPSVGEVIDIEIVLENPVACGGGMAEYPGSFLSINLPLGVIHEPNDDFPETTIYIDDNELDPDGTYVLRVIIDDFAPSDQELIISANLISNDPCYDGSIDTEITTITLCTQPIPDFTAQIVNGECGIYNYFSSSTNLEIIHRWYLNEQTENSLFSMEANPVNHMLPNGIHIIIHVVEGICDTEIFELQLPPVNCDNSLFTCPCTDGDAFNIEAGTGTLLSQLINIGLIPANGVSNKCLAINGHLIVDAASTGTSGFYEILNSEVRMQPGSSITVQAGGSLSILGSDNEIGVHGCEELWRGISLEPAPDGSNGGRLYLAATKVEDAVHAVELGDNSTFEMVFTTLNRNYIGIYMPPSPSSEPQTVFQPTFPAISSITSTGDLLPHYLGVSQTNTNSYAGIELNDCSGFQAGGGNLLGIIMSDANHGVVANNSNVSIFRSAIFNMVPNPLDFRSNSGILADNHSLIELRNSRLFNLNTGIYGRESSLILTENIIGEISEGDAQSDTQNGIFSRTNFGNFINISKNNQFHVNHIGISVSTAQRANSIDIDENSFEITPLPGNAGFGITLHDALISGNNEEALSITRNSINIREYGHGITLDNVNGVSLGQNDISFTSLVDQNISARGIWLALSSDNFLYDNLISGTSVSNNIWGIDVIHGDRNKLCCNSIERTNIGTHFTGPCEGTTLRHTAYVNNDIGLQCGLNTRLSPQFAAGNTWLPTSSVQARHLSNVVSDITQSRFFAAGSTGSSTKPLNETQPNISIEWFANGTTAGSCEEDLDNCERPEVNELAFNSILTNDILEDRFLYGMHPETSNWEAKRAFYRSQLATNLSDQSNWSSESEAYFYNQTQSKSILHQLTVIDKFLEELHVEDLVCTEYENRITSLSEEVYSLDKTFVEGEEPSEAYLSERASLIQQRNEAFIQYSALLKQSNITAANVMEQLQFENDQITTDADAAYTVIEINNLYFNTIGKNLEILPSVLESRLREVAEKCPQQYGSAVVRAQSILKHFDKQFNASTECKDDSKHSKMYGSSDKLKSTKGSAVADNDINIFPNPVSGTLTIQHPYSKAAQSNQIELLTSTGQIILSKTFTGQQTSLDLSNYSAGLYWVRIQSTHGIISNRIIIK